MMLLVRIVAGLHLAVYLGIMWYGWQSYKKFRKPSWKVMGIGFTIFLLYRIREFILQMNADYPIDIVGTLIPFIGSLFLLIAFWMLCGENKHIVELMKQFPSQLLTGDQPVEFWFQNLRVIFREEVAAVREIVREEIAAASGTTTVTVKGPSATIPEVAVEDGPK